MDLNEDALRKELEDALLKRIAVTKEENKKKKKIRLIILCAVVAVVALLFVRMKAKDAHNAQLRNFATETMNKDYSNVYADLVTIEPSYEVYFQNGAYRNTTGIVCACKTVEGKEIWVVFDEWNYPSEGYTDKTASYYGNAFGSGRQYHSITYGYRNPLRVTGNVNTAKQVDEKLKKEIGDVFVLEVTETKK